MRNCTLLLSILLICGAMGCQYNQKFSNYDEKVDEDMGLMMKVPVYFWDRFLDLTDIVQLDLGFGGGALFNVHVTKGFQVGAGYRDAVCFGFLPRSFGMWYEEREEVGLAIAFTPFHELYYKEYAREGLWGTTTLFDHDVYVEGQDSLSHEATHNFDIGVSLHFLMGMDVNVSPFQAFDFVFGWFGMPFLVPVDPVGFGTELDVANDDSRARDVRNADPDMPYYNYNRAPYPLDKNPLSVKEQ
jgi:hypothetical protein